MQPITFWRKQGTLFGLQSRPALAGDDEQHFLWGVDGTEQAFRSLCAVENSAPCCPQTQADFARFFRAFHRAACQAHFPAREENTGIEELLLWFPERTFLDLNMHNTSLSLSFDLAGDYWLSVEMTKTKSAFHCSWDLSREVDWVEYGVVTSKQHKMERWGQKIYSFKTYEQAYDCLFELLKTSDFSHDVFPQQFFLARDLELSAGILTVRNVAGKRPVLPKRLKKPALPKKFKKLTLNTEECMEIDSSGSVHFQVESGGTFLNATVGCSADQRQPFVSYYWEWSEDRWEEGYGWLDSEKESVRSIDCSRDQLSNTLYRCLLLMFDGIVVRRKGFYQALFAACGAAATGPAKRRRG